MSAGSWSTPYYGVQHLGSFSVVAFWATVSDYGTFALSHLWTPGCGFSPMEEQHTTAAEARVYSEKRLTELTGRQWTSN